MFKNISKYGLEKQVDGKLGFAYRVVSSELKKPEAVVANALGSSLQNKNISSEKNLKAVEQRLSECSATEKLPSPSGKKKHKVTASGVPAFGGIGNANNMAGSSVGSLTPYLPILDGIINADDWVTKRKIYRDIYSYDLAGAVVDIFANLPFSDFNLVGIDDKGVLDTYASAIANLPLRSMLPAITVDYLVNGAFLGSLDYRDSKFNYLFPHNLDDAIIKNLGLFVGDPIVDVKLPPQILEVLDITGDPRIDALKEKLPPYMTSDRNGNNVIQLEPEYTMYIPRGGMSTANMGSSFFNRILTIHLVEKALIKGTIESAQRRQRAIMHIQAGIDGVWEPTNEELTQIANLVLAADLDPISGIVVTRNGVQFSDIKAGSDFWNWTEIFDFATKAKLEALGVNEGILSGDASFNTLEAALSSFMDNITYTRELISNKVFEEKLFKIVAKDNGFYKENKTGAVLSTIDEPKKVEYINPLTILAVNNNKDEDGREYNMPTILWERQLKPHADTDYMEILQRLEEKGIPIPLRLYAAAGGENIDDLIKAMDNDAELQIKIAENKKALIEDAKREKVLKFLNVEGADSFDEGGFDNNDFGGDNFGSDNFGDDNFSDNEPSGEEENPENTLSSSVNNINKGILSSANKARHITELDNLYGPRIRDSEGRRRPLTPEMRKHIEDKANQQISDALKKMSEK